MIRELFGRYAEETEDCFVILSGDAPKFPAGEQLRIPWRHGQGIKRVLFQSLGLNRYCRDAVLLTTDSKVPFFLPKNCLPVTVVTDMAVYRMPEVYRLSRVLLWKLQYLYLRRRDARYIAISEFTKREMAELLKLPSERITVLPCACVERLARVEDAAELARLREKYALSEEYILFVGNSNPRKNLERTVQAFDLLKERTKLRHQLVIAGEQGWKFDREKALAGLLHKEDIRFTGYIPDEDMAALYSGAGLFLFPTLYEGFGMPVIEAQHCGVPVVTSNCSALPETAGEGAVLVDPYDAESICQGMERVLCDRELAKELAEKGLRNAERFSWAESAEGLKRLLEKEKRT